LSDGKLVELDMNIKSLIESKKDHETRMRGLELHYAKASGYLIAISGIIQIAIHFLSKVVK